MAEPVSLSEAKAQCRMENDSSDDTFITSLIAPARAYVERVSTYPLVDGAKTYVFTQFGDFLEIYQHGISAITEVAYIDTDGADATYDAFLEQTGYPYRIFPGIDDSFPALGDGGTVTVTLSVTAISATSQEYLIAKRAILILIGHWFEYREAAQAGIVSSEIAFCITSLLDTLRPVSAY